MADHLTREGRSRNMAAIRSKNTKAELVLRKALFRKGYRYRLHYQIIGKPDVAFVSKKIAIFVDGDFWHGFNWKVIGRTPPKGFWQDKINKNIERDKEVNKYLKDTGWKVVRFWEHDINNNLGKCIEKVKNIYFI